MVTQIFVNRANVDYNKEKGLELRPCWIIKTGDQSIECFGWSVRGHIETKANFTNPLAVDGGVHLWLETTQEVIIKR